MSQPFSPPQIPEKVRTALAIFDPSAVARAEGFLATSARPCVDFDCRRASTAPLRRGLLGRLLGLAVAKPQLPVLASKFGGRPYVTAADTPWPKDCTFLMQINLADLPVSHVRELPVHGILALDLKAGSFRNPWAHRVRFYPEPSEVGAVDPGRVRCRGAYEAALRFACGWSYPDGDAWAAAVGVTTKDPASESWSEWHSEAEPLPLGQMRHRILGHPAAGVAEMYGFTPPVGSIADYEMLLRIDFDNAAAFHWGSNVVYVVIHRDDLKAGRLDRARLSSANY
jgi:hypothetical protein